MAAKYIDQTYLVDSSCNYSTKQRTSATMSSVHTLASMAAAVPTASSSIDARPAPQLFPTTTNHALSKFNDIQAGPQRTLMPSWTTKEEERAWRKEHLVLCFRALHRAGLAEGAAGTSTRKRNGYDTCGSRVSELELIEYIGHCSTRDPVQPDTFWVNPQGRSFARLRVSDLVRVSARTGEVVEGSAPVDASATSIHAPIYRAMGRGPGEQGGSEGGAEAVVHVHGPYSKGTKISHDAHAQCAACGV
jgi:hypothetical protein